MRGRPSTVYEKQSSESRHKKNEEKTAGVRKEKGKGAETRSEKTKINPLY